MKKILLLAFLSVPVLMFGQSQVFRAGSVDAYSKTQSDSKFLSKDFSMELGKNSNPDSLLVINKDEVGYAMKQDMRIKSNAYFTTDTNTYFTGVDVIMDMSVSAVTQHKLRVWPIIPGRTMTFDKIAVEVTTAQAGSNFIMGIYSDNGYGYPDTLLLKTKVFDGSSQTVQTEQLTTDLVLNGNTLYFIAMSNSNSATIFRGIDAQGLPNVFGHNTGDTKGGRTCITVDRNYDGDLPATFPAKSTAGYGYLMDSVMPCLFMQQK